MLHFQPLVLLLELAQRFELSGHVSIHLHGDALHANTRKLTRSELSSSVLILEFDTSDR